MSYFVNIFEKIDDPKEKWVENQTFIKEKMQNLEELLTNVCEKKREKIPRLFHLSNAELRKLFFGNFQTFSLFLPKLFPGIKAIVIKTYEEKQKIHGFLCEDDESLNMKENFDLIEDYAHLISFIEQNSKKLIQENFTKSLSNVMDVNQNFVNFWKLFINKQSFLQSLFLAIDIKFAHEITEKITEKYEFEEFLEKNEDFFKFFLETVKPKKQFFLYFDSFVMKIMGKIRILKHFQGENICDSFDFYAWPRFSLVVKSNLLAKSPIEMITNLKEDSQFSIDLLAMNYRQPYGFNITNPCKTYLFVIPSIQRLFFNFLQTFQLKQGVFLSNPLQKKGFKSLSKYLARPVFSKLSLKIYKDFETSLIRTKKTEFFLLFSLETFEFSVLSKISLFFSSYIMTNPIFATKIGLFLTNSIIKNSQYEEIPRNLLEKFRNVQFFEIDIAKIIEIRLFVLLKNDKQANFLSKKIIFFSSLLNNSLEIQPNLNEISIFSEWKSQLIQKNFVFNDKVLMKIIDISLKIYLEKPKNSSYINVLREAVEVFFLHRVVKPVFEGILILFSQVFHEESFQIERQNSKDLQWELLKNALIQEYLKRKELDFPDIFEKCQFFSNSQ